MNGSGQKFVTGRGKHVAVFDTKEEACEYMQKFKDHSEYMVFLRQHAEGDWYVEVIYKGY